MPVSVLPKVMSRIEGNDKQSATYRLLKCNPELRNVYNRVSFGQRSNKRLKMGVDHNSCN
jgi:hypothetical protein